MNDWYSTYLFNRQRQAEVVRQAERRRLLDEGRGIGWEAKSAGGLWGIPLRYRLGQMLVLLGRALQHPGPGIPAA
jgi:hypothetical protein